jgi:hypothetical protein
VKTMLALALALVGFISAPVVYAQAELTGKWQGETRNGSRVLLDLTFTKGEVTGTLTRNDETSPITEGKSSNKAFQLQGHPEWSTGGHLRRVGRRSGYGVAGSAGPRGRHRAETRQE